MFAVSMSVAVTVLVLLVVATLVGVKAGPVHVADELTVAPPIDGPETSLFRVLSQVRGVTLRKYGPGNYTLTSSRRPAWTWLVAILFFPVGLFALLVRRSMTLTVTVGVAGPAGQELRVFGQAPLRVATEVGRILAPMGSATAAARQR